MNRQLTMMSQTTNPANLNEDLRAALTTALGLLMSEISETFWAARWLSGTEDSLPNACAQRLADQEPTGDYKGLSREQASYLTWLANVLGHWSKPNYATDGNSYQPHQPPPIDGHDED